MGYEGFTKLRAGLYRDNKTGKIGKLMPTGHGGWYVEDITRQEYQFEKYKQATDSAYDRYVKTRDLEIKSPKDVERLERAKKAYLKAYKQEEERNLAIKNEEKYDGDLSKIKGKHVEEPEILKGATKEEKENYYRNLAEKQKMEKMGTTAYLMEKQRERGSSEETNNLQTKARNVIEGMANDRIKEKENTLANDKAMLEGMKRKGINEVQGFTQKDFENRINKNEEYLKIAKGEAYQNSGGAVVEIINKDKNGWTTYSIQKSPTTPPSYITLQEGNVKNMLKDNGYEKVGNKYATNNGSGSDDNTSAYADKAIKYWEKQREDTIARGGDTSWEDDSIKKWEKEKENRLYGERLNNDISPMSEYSDTTGTGYSDKQTKALESGAYDKRTATELRKQLKALEPYTQELQVGDRVIVNTGGGRYGVRNKDDYDDPMTDYSAYVYGFNAKSIIERARENGIVVDKPVSKKVKNAEATIKRYRQRKQGTTIDTMSKRQLATRIAEIQAERGIISKEDIDKHITRKMRDYNKKQLRDYFK